MRKLSNRGLTLTELLLAAAILVFALSGILVLYTSCIILNDSNRNLTTALNHAQYIVEGIKNVPFDNIITDVNSDGNWNWNISSINNNGLAALSNETITTTATGTNPIVITVTVNWSDRGLRARSTTLQTSIANY